MSEFEISAGTWVTAGGYIVTLHRFSSINYFVAPQKMSPGVDRNGKTVEQSCADRNYGWLWNKNGSINLSPEWSEKLRIVNKFEGNLDDYEWKGYPMIDNISLKKPKKVITGPGWYITTGDYLVEIVKSTNYGWISSAESSSGFTQSDFTGKHTGGWCFKDDGTCNNSLQKEWEDKLKIVKKIEMVIPDGWALEEPPRMAKPEHNQYYLLYDIVTNKFGLNQTPYIYPHVPTHHGEYGYKRPILVKKNSDLKIYNTYTSCTHSDPSIIDAATVRGVEIGTMTSISNEPHIHGVATLIENKQSRLNYWIIEPTFNLLRHAIIAATIGGIGFSVMNPKSVISVIKSCIPKISIEAPEIINGK